MGTWGIQNTLYDKEGKELASIKQTKIGFNEKEALMDIPGDNNYKIKGDKFAVGFEIHRTETGKLAATVRREVGIRNYYAVSVEDGEDIVACILCFALIDGVYHPDDSGEGTLIDNMMPAFVKGKDPHASVKENTEQKQSE